MRIIRGISSFPIALKNGVVAIGNFDGVHLGHRAVLSEAARVAKAAGAPLLALTFHPHPREFFSPASAPLAIDRFRLKAQKMQALSVDGLVVLRFNAPLASMPAEDFVKEILVSALAARHVVTGEHFAFGAKRGGNAEFLHACADKYGFGYSAVTGVAVAGEACSSTRIRAHLAAGDVAGAAALLGAPYAITGRVVHGDARGRTLGFPTANIIPHRLFLPAYGVYAAKVSIDTMLATWKRAISPRSGAPCDEPLAHHGGNQPFNAVVNIGTRPTVGGSEPRVEVHLLEFEGDLYGARLSVQLIHRLREERRFASLEALQAQITADITLARNLL